MIDAHIGRGERIDGVGVRRWSRRQNAHVADEHVVAVIGNELPEGRVLDGDALDAHMLAVVEDNEARAGMRIAHNAGIAHAAHHFPPAFALAVDGAFAGDGHVLSIGGAHQPLRRGQAELDFRRIVVMIGRAEQRGAFVELQSDVAFEHDGRTQIGARSEANGAAALGRASVDGTLNGGGVLGGSVTLGAEVAGVAGFGGMERA